MSGTVFISYATPDRKVAESVCMLIEMRGLSCWIAPRDVPPGSDWAEAIIRALEQSRALVLIFSEHSNVSPAVGSELEKAFALGIPVIPLRLREVQPSRKLELFVRRVQWVDAFMPPIEVHVARLADAICSLTGSLEASPTPSVAPSTPGDRGSLQPTKAIRRRRLWSIAIAIAAVVVAAAVWGSVWKAGRTIEPSRPDEPNRLSQMPAKALASQGSAKVTKGVPLEAKATNFLGMEFVLIRPGGFRMGSPESDPDARDVEKPQHLVNLTRPFYLGVFEVTQRQFESVMGTTPSYHNQKIMGRPTGALPVEGVTWSDAVKFCRKLCERERKSYRLPTEAEWEYACRAGSLTRFSTGEQPGDLQKVAIIAGETVSHDAPMEVGCLQPNAWGLFDMLGNVREFCADWHGPYNPELQIDPQGPKAGKSHVVRGGCYHFRWQDARCAARFPVEGPAPNVGFRVLLEP
jgi:formylglycine-generating enzyme required for sulfatase activity